MMIIQEFKKKYKENPKFKQKIQRATLFLGAFVIGASIFYAVNTTNDTVVENSEDNPIQIQGNYVPADTAKFVQDKNYFYVSSDKNNRENQSIINDNPIGSSLDNMSSADRQAENDNSSIEEYMRQRNASVRAMQQGTSSNNYSGGYSANRRTYNQYGNSNDYVVSNTTTGGGYSYNNNAEEVSANRRNNPFANNNTQTSNTPSDVTARKTTGEEQEVQVRLLSQRDYIQSGERLTFMLLEPCVISGVQVAKGQTLRGVAQENGDRLIIRFQTLKVGSQVVSAKNITLYGSDGIEGIPLTGDGEESYAFQKGSEIARSSSNRIPVVGGVVSDVIGHTANTERTKTTRKIKVNKNFTCFVVIGSDE